MDSIQFRHAAHATIEQVIEYYESLSTFRVVPNQQPGFLRPLIAAEAPQKPEPFASVLEDMRSTIFPGLTHWQSPNFLAYFPAGVTYPSILGELFSAAINSPGFNWISSPVHTEHETIILDQVAKALGLPNIFLSEGDGGGVIQGSASESVLVAMVAARERYVTNILLKEGLLPASDHDSEEVIRGREDRAMDIRSQMVALGTSQAHSSTQKAAAVIGVRFRSINVGLATDCSLTEESLSVAFEKYRDEGLIPFYLTATIGTTGTCAIDDLAGIARFRQLHPEFWIHIDAAYAGSALICPELRERCQAQYLQHFDSFVVNLHKWLLVNFDASCMYVRDRSHIIKALSVSAAYLQNPEAFSGLVTDYRDWQLPLGRRFRSLKIWFVLRTYGLEALQEIVRTHVRLGELFGKWCRSRRAREAGIVVVAGPTLALNVIRLLPQPRPELDTPPAVSQESNHFTHRVYETINDDGRIFLTHCQVDGIDCIRIVGANLNTTEASLRHAFEVIVECTENIRQKDRTKDLDGVNGFNGINCVNGVNGVNGSINGTINGESNRVRA